MFKITEFTVETIADPFKILEGDRYEFIMDLEVEEDDELFHEEGVILRVIYVVDAGTEKIVKHEFQTGDAGKYIDFEMEDDEIEMVAAFCKVNFS